MKRMDSILSCALDFVRYSHRFEISSESGQIAPPFGLSYGLAVQPIREMGTRAV
jgi:hypothetical protein